MGVISIAIYAVLAIYLSAMFLLWRNSWVYRVRTQTLEKSIWDGDDLYPYAKLPSYEAMIWRFWIWDVNKFLETGK